MSPTEFTWAGRARSFVHAAHGLRVLYAEHNSKIHLTATLAVIGLALALGVGRSEWIALVLAMSGVWTAEALNTAVEQVCDAVTREAHPGIQAAKDVAAAAVLIAAAGALAVGALVFVPHLLRLIASAS